MSKLQTAQYIITLLLAANDARGNWREALDHANKCRDTGSRDAEAAYATAEKLGSLEQHEGLALIWNDWGVFRFNLGLYEQALPLFQKALGSYAEIHESDGMQAGFVMHNLAMVKRAIGERTDAERLHLQSLAILEHHLGSSDVSVAQGFSELAMLYLDTGRVDQARILMKRALQSGSRALGPKDEILAAWWVGMSEVDRQAGAFDAARFDLKHALDVFPVSQSHQSASMAMVINQQARVEYETRHYSKARDYWERALLILERIPASNVDDILGIKVCLARIQATQGASVEAERALTALVETAERVGSVTALAAALRFLAVSYLERKREDLALPLLRQSLLLVEQRSGDHSLSMALGLNELSRTLLALKLPAEAANFSSKAIAIVGQSTSPAPAWVELLATHGKVLLKLKLKKESARIFHQIKEIKEANPQIPAQTITASELASAWSNR